MEVPIDWSTWGPAKVWWDYAYPNKRMPVENGDSVDLSGWNNLLWFWIVPQHEGQPCSGIHSSPVVIGGNVYFVCDDGHIFAYPAEPRVESGRAIDQVVWEGKITGASGAANLSIAGSNGVVLIPAPDGLHAHTNATTLVADSNRLVEVDGAGEVRWEVSSVSWPVSVSQGGTPAMASGPVNKPSRAKYLPSGEILLVNSGANQVCRIDKSGVAGLGGLAGKYIRGVYDKFVDPKNLLRPGQPTHLSGPTDALFWQDYELVNNVMMRVDHCVIADSGNHRVLDLVYRFKIDASTGAPTELIVTEEPGRQPDPATGFYLPELNWVTVTESVNERYVYECLQLVPSPTGGHDIYAAVSNYRGSLPESPPGNVRTEGLGGAIFALSYRVPGSTGTSWDYSHSQSGRIVAACDRMLVNGQVFPLAGPRFFQVIDRSAGRFILICDNYGVYEVGPITGGIPPVTRAFRDQDYRNINRDMTSFSDGGIAGSAPIYVPLMASSVQELINGNWLITNNYSGSNAAGDKSFSGEVFEVSWKNDGTVNRVEWCSPGLYVLGNDLSTWKQRLESSYIFQQPRSAVRQM
ncbi:MAG: hypothetical protein N3B12_09345 [Armatimonadetes bacterium]|nr:hypothetical protein [Armatimonadota bacterium]